MKRLELKLAQGTNIQQDVTMIYDETIDIYMYHCALGVCHA